jgi:serine/threonine protein kinase
LGDFGISRKIEATMRKQFTYKIGTESYMAPEMFEGADYDKQVDIWALGIVLY